MDYANDREEIKDIKNSHEPTHTIHMTKEQIIARCKEKEQQLLNRYFGSLIDEAASERPETIGEYTKNLPLEIAAEFRKFLKELWEEVAPEAEKGKPCQPEKVAWREDAKAQRQTLLIDLVPVQPKGIHKQHPCAICRGSPGGMTGQVKE